MITLSCTAMAQDSTSYSSYTERRTLQRFNPRYGGEQEANNLISFVSSNIAVELSPEQVKGVDGVVVCSVLVDTMGVLKDFRVENKLRPWIDHAIVNAMARLPNYGTPCIRRNEKIERRFSLVFSFGSFIKPLRYMGFNGSEVDRQTQAHINAQKDAIKKELAARNTKWNGFVKNNAKLEYDNQGALRKEQSVLPGSTNPLNPDTPTFTTPTITISGKE